MISLQKMSVTSCEADWHENQIVDKRLKRRLGANIIIYRNIHSNSANGRGASMRRGRDRAKV